MGRCARQTKKAIKALWRTLKPVVMQFTGTVVGIIAKTDWQDDDKRKEAFKLIKAAYPDTKDNAIHAAITLAIETLKKGETALAELGQVDASDEQEIEDLDGDGHPG